MMNLADYQTAAERTMTDPDNTHRMLNAALGICGEAAEVAKSFEWDDSELLGECGDLLWYVAQMCKANGETIANLKPDDQGWNEETALAHLWHHSGYVADAVKKLVFHQKPFVQVVFWDSLYQIVIAVDTLLGFHGKNISDACEHNVAKLLKRFPNGFNYADANRRADEVSA
jgi:hypothetical protein